ncbi:hypothetical protein BUALT_Bualt19G0130800 [Buddleja alternifolia]|uniref:GDSL esterase/lipase n=1 Tax=Buddleja alternifolia TaxID=168488 RepID=A0AAV6WAT1_9LAMI|nr:hypothetical protein BUALT_Bualt19G0130800 [Buddleja alternifolia]
MYAFGDSLSDPGNNEKVSANYWPYDTIANGTDVLSGVNYVSSGSRILEDTGYILFGKQIDNLKSTVIQLGNQMQKEELSNYLAKALVFVLIGGNDYINNYMVPVLYKSSLIYDPQQYADLLILELHRLGLRKFCLTEIPPVGCIPIELTIHVATSPGECASSSNNLVQMFNIRPKSLVHNLNSGGPGSIFTLGASFQMFTDLRDNADTYVVTGLKVKDKACCRIGNNTIGAGVHHRALVAWLVGAHRVEQAEKRSINTSSVPAVNTADATHAPVPRPPR